MKTPLEAIDELIEHLCVLRTALERDSTREALEAYAEGLVSYPMIHFMPSVKGDSEKAKPLARLLAPKWTKSEQGSWMADFLSLHLCIHNAEPARNPQPETVEL